MAKALLSCVFVVVFFICMTLSLSGSGSQAATASQMQTVGAHRWAAAALPCHDVYICSEGNFQSKNAPKFQQTGRKRRGNGSKQQLLQLDQVNRGFRIPVLGSWSPSRRRGRVLRFTRPVWKHSSQFGSKEKPEFPSGSAGHPMADGGGWDRIGPLEQKPAEIPENQRQRWWNFLKIKIPFSFHTHESRGAVCCYVWASASCSAPSTRWMLLMDRYTSSSGS